MPALYRETFDAHIFGHQNCLIANLQIPPEFAKAWAKAIAWQPKIDGWTHTFEQALECVILGVRPILYGWPYARMKTASETHQLEFIDLGWISACFHIRNSDLAELFEWSHAQPDQTQHLVNGIVLGYPLEYVEAWVANGCPGRTLKEELELATNEHERIHRTNSNSI